ncbi:hypothetical protein HDV00_008815 [Rhizophlyctis rosea]|nr:hypothetical protein HDV00_008815 [Rhizophlyctis rosea]
MPGITPIHLAVQSPSLPILTLLLSNPTHRAGINTRDGSAMESTPLHLAAGKNLSEFVAKLMEHGADVLAKDAAGRTALYIACEEGFAEVVGTILEHVHKTDGAEGVQTLLSIVGGDGLDCTSRAVMGGYIDVVKMLMAGGAKETPPPPKKHPTSLEKTKLKRRHTLLHPSMATPECAMDNLIKELEGVLKKRKAGGRGAVAKEEEEHKTVEVVAVSVAPAAEEEKMLEDEEEVVKIQYIDIDEVVAAGEVDWECL